MDHVIELILVIVTGLCTGSFVTALAWRLPRGLPFSTDRNGQPIRSICPPCGRRLTWLELVPVFSWLMQSGRCKCGKRQIPIRYPLIELITLVYTYLLFVQQGFALDSFGYYLVMPFALTAAVIAWEGGAWNQGLFRPLIGLSIANALCGFIFRGGLPSLVEGVGVTALVWLVAFLQGKPAAGAVQTREFRLVFSILFLLWLLFFPVLSK